MAGFLAWWRDLLPRFLTWWLDLFRRVLAAVRPSRPDSPIAGMPLRYLIGANSPIAGEDGCVVMVPFGAPAAQRGLTAGYCNAFDETGVYDPDANAGMFGPYRRPTPTAHQYGEGVPDQDGEGYRRNIVAQLDLRTHQGIALCEIDNPDAYPVDAVILAIGWAQERGIKVLAKNPGSQNIWQEDFTRVVAHPNVIGIICESGAGNASSMHELRCRAGRFQLPVRFVAYNDGEGGEAWADAVAREIRDEDYVDMGVTYSDAVREYASSRDILRPVL